MHLPRRSAPVILSALTATALGVACSGGAATPAVSIPPLPSISVPAVSIPSLPSISIPPLPSGLPSISIPSLPSISIPPLPSGAGLPHEVPDLEALLPSQIRGITLEKGSFSGEKLFSGGLGGDAVFRAVFQQFSKQPSDLGYAGASDTTNTLAFDLTALRLAGVDGSQFMGAYLAASQASGSIQPTTSSGNLGGKPVTVFTGPDGTKSYGYVKGDVVFILASDADDADALLGEIAAALP